MINPPVRTGTIATFVLCASILSCGDRDGSSLPDRTFRAGGGELVVASSGDEYGLQANRRRLGMYPLNASICESLVRLSHDFRPVPWLARAWEYKGDNTFRFIVRKDVRFHNGRPLDAASVKFSIDATTAANTQNSFLSPESVRIINDSTVDIRPALPNLRLVDQLVHPSYSIVAAGTDPSVRPVCTGPFRFGSYVPHSHLTVVRNDDYWEEKAKVPAIRFRFIADQNARALALQSGEVDAIFEPGLSNVAALRASPRLQILKSAPGAVIMIYIAVHGPPPYTLLADADVRRAMAMAIDKELLAKKVLEGYAAAASTVNPPNVLGEFAETVHGIPHDPARARRLLDSAGWKSDAGGTRHKLARALRLVMIVQSGAVDEAISEYVQAELNAVGFDVKIESLDAATFGQRLNAGMFDFDIEIPSQNDANPAFLLSLRWYSKSNIKGMPVLAAGARFDSLVSAALLAGSRRDAQRAAASAMHVLVDEDAVAIPLAAITRIFAMSRRVRDFDPNPSRTNQWWSSVSLSK